MSGPDREPQAVSAWAFRLDPSDIEERGTTTQSVPARPAGAELAFEAAFGRYLLFEKLGAGGSGMVFRAYDRALCRFVALKILSVPLSERRTHARFVREIQAAARLDHPGIVKVFEVGAHDGHGYYTMPLLEGRSLAYLEPAERTPVRVAQIGSQVARALHFAHERGLVHRDVKPSNVVLGLDGRPVLVDLGLARDIAPDEAITTTGSLVGTPAYMSPEQVRGSRMSIDARSDIYNLGVTLYELLAGRLPFVGHSTVELLRQIVRAVPRPPSAFAPQVPSVLDEIVLKALAKTPADRHPTALALALDLEAFVASDVARRSDERPTPPTSAGSPSIA